MTIPPKPQYPLKSPSVSPWAYIPYLEPQKPIDQETTDQFRARALNACLDTYLEYASQRLQTGKPLNQQETIHLIHHIKASGHFRSPRQIVWGTRSTEEQLDYKSDYESASTWLVCREDVFKGVRFFDFFVGQTIEQGLRIDGPHFEGPSDFEIYIAVGQKTAQSSLVSLGKWTYARGLSTELEKVLGRVAGLLEPHTQEALQARELEKISEGIDGQDDDSQKRSRDSGVDLLMDGV